ncbi:MAG: UDP-glucose:undecaprenyl-phosphate glucose-1-phosphate transferase [Pelotomaculum sp. PtaB.Bin104]|nr:MAG: UDP-glucose:undecaprenyl-phosphate glucose-1-phosphate transferase [Pelotomaculum sp. PtaB.Bin104]
MHLRLIPPCGDEASDRLRNVLSLPRAGGLFQQQVLRNNGNGIAEASSLYVPSEWLERLDKSKVPLRGYDREGLSGGILEGAKDGLLISNALLDCRCNHKQLNDVLKFSSSEVVLVDITFQLAAPNEIIRTTHQNRIVGIRRILEDMTEPIPAESPDFPAYLYFPPSVCKRFGREGRLPMNIEALRCYLNEKGISIRRYRLGGEIHNLNSPEGLLYLLQKLPFDEFPQLSSIAIDPTARLIGPVWADDDVYIEQNAVVAGPSILCKGVQIGAGAVVQNTVLAPALKVEAGEHLQNTLWLEKESRQHIDGPIRFSTEYCERAEVYREWPLFSYARFGKRLFDIVLSLCILVLISLIFPVVVIMLKLTSPGPIFYRARRQGLHGKEFNCLKFRTMMTQADSLQERLRIVNEVDGPQFKINNDPRVTGVGKFLRDTCIDELPQFINVLLGDMSVVGPRPSPENENDSCPAWRDARLSVRPGITGLWQVCRTRQASQDFQEWVYYDTQYVRNLSFRQDVYICFKTASKLIHTFLDQFG